MPGNRGGNACAVPGEPPRFAGDARRRNIGRRSVDRQIIAVAKRVDDRSVDGKQNELPTQLLQFVEVERDEEGPLVETVPPGCQ